MSFFHKNRDTNPPTQPAAKPKLYARTWEKAAASQGMIWNSAPSVPSKAETPAPYGVSWGDEMPAEENQFNFNGPYHAYFEQIYLAEFPEYRLAKVVNRYSSSTVFTFWNGSRQALVVELLSENSSTKKLRQNCLQAGIPYLRFYHNHYGWWNTRRYVVSRTRAALG